MISRIAVSLTIVFTALFGIAWQHPTAVDRRPILYVFKQIHCPPCNAWKAAYDDPRDPRLRNSINKCFRLRVVWSHQRPDLVSRYHVGSFPTFLSVTDAGTELRRVEGFPGGEPLYRALTRSEIRPVESVPMERPPIVRPDPAAERRRQRIEQANERLQEQIRDLEDALALSDEELNRQKQRTQDAAEAAVDEGNARLAEERQRLIDEIEKLRIRKARPPDPVDRGRGSAIGEAINGEGTQPGISNEIPEASGTLGKWVSFGAKVVKVGAAIAAPEVSIPLGMAGTVAGFAFNARRKRRKRKGAAQPADFPVDDVPALPRDNTEIEQVIGLRQQEKREPLHDAFFGIAFEDEYRTDPDRTVKEAFQAATDRFNNVAPLSTTETRLDSTTTTNRSE